MMERPHGWLDHHGRSDHRLGEHHVRTSIGAMLRELLEAVPTIRSVATYRDGEQLAGMLASVLDGAQSEPHAGDGLPVTRALLALIRSGDGAGPEGRQCVIVRRGREHQLLLPVRGGYLSFVFDEVPARHGAAVRRAADVLSRHGIRTLWVAW